MTDEVFSKTKSKKKKGRVRSPPRESHIFHNEVSKVASLPDLHFFRAELPTKSGRDQLRTESRIPYPVPNSNNTIDEGSIRVEVSSKILDELAAMKKQLNLILNELASYPRAAPLPPAAPVVAAPITTTSFAAVAPPPAPAPVSAFEAVPAAVAGATAAPVVKAQAAAERTVAQTSNEQKEVPEKAKKKSVLENVRLKIRALGVFGLAARRRKDDNTIQVESTASQKSGKWSVYLHDGYEEEEHSIKTQLQKNLLLAEKIEEQRSQERALKSNSACVYYKEKYKRSSSEEKEVFFETLMGWIIGLNAIYVGFALDYETKDEPMWLVANLTFSAIFIFELLAKVWCLTPHEFFLGQSKTANIFDVVLVIVDLGQLAIELCVPGMTTDSDVPAVSIFRLLRLAKLIRLIRLLRSEAFKDLLSMIQGMLEGMPTLFWAQVFFLIIVYIYALVYRELLGKREVENVKHNFQSVPRSIFTVFRCSFGYCDSRNGTPIFEHVYDYYGPGYVALQCAFIFFMAIGLFNVVSAIYVEATMACSLRMEREKKKRRLRDAEIWSSNIAMLIKKIFEYDEDSDEPEVLSDAIEAIRNMDVHREVIDKMVKDKDAKDALNALDIDPNDNEYLSEILDPDDSGTITLVEFIDGLRRLRGDPRRSDIVSISMVVHEIQKVVHEIRTQTKRIDQHLYYVFEAAGGSVERLRNSDKAK